MIKTVGRDRKVQRFLSQPFFIAEISRYARKFVELATTVSDFEVVSSIVSTFPKPLSTWWEAWLRGGLRCWAGWRLTLRSFRRGQGSARGGLEVRGTSLLREWHGLRPRCEV